jgi:ubiquinol oxidase
MTRTVQRPPAIASVAAISAVTAALALSLFGLSEAFAVLSYPASCSAKARARAERGRRSAQGFSDPWSLGVVSRSSLPTSFGSQKIRNPDEDSDDCLLPLDVKQLQSPALVRGTPLGDSDKSRNRELVRAIKTFLFDTLFGGPVVASGAGAASAATAAGTIQDGLGSDEESLVLQMSYRRFYALETIARTPYFAYVSALHLLETIGQWRQADYLKLHFCEAWNELHHLLILEQLLGGSIPWRDRFVAQHVAVGYYWFAVSVYLLNPALAYNLNQAVEEEAYETYQGFLGRHGPYLKMQPAPDVAKQYYAGEDLYLFDSMHHRGSGSLGAAPASRRPTCETLYDTFTNIRDDEMEHVKTMAYLQGECQQDDGNRAPKSSDVAPSNDGVEI